MAAGHQAAVTSTQLAGEGSAVSLPPTTAARGAGPARLSGAAAAWRSGWPEPRLWVQAVDGVTLTVARGEMLALVGETGCGKTTTVQTILRRRPHAGAIRLKGKDITALSQRKMRPLRRRMQIVYQDPYESLDPRFRVRPLEEPLQVHGLGGTRAERRRCVSRPSSGSGCPRRSSSWTASPTSCPAGSAAGRDRRRASS